jgi:hypothetical protein
MPGQPDSRPSASRVNEEALWNTNNPPFSRNRERKVYTGTFHLIALFASTVKCKQQGHFTKNFQ